jgi:hypothetical protein
MRLTFFSRESFSRISSTAAGNTTSEGRTILLSETTPSLLDWVSSYSNYDAEVEKESIYCSRGWLVHQKCDCIPLDEELGVSLLYLRSCIAAVLLPLQPFGCKDLRFPKLVHHTPRNHNDMRYSSTFQTTNFEDVDPQGRNREYPTISLHSETQSQTVKEKLLLKFQKMYLWWI